VLFKTVPQAEGAERGGFMRRFLTLVCLLGLALPAGVSISGCYRNPAGAYCNGLGYGLKDTDLFSLTLQPEFAGISLAYGQTTQAQAPTGAGCHGGSVAISSGTLSWGTTNNQLVDISPTGSICAGTWNRNTGGGIADFTYCNFPTPQPQTCNPPGSKNCQPYAVAYITATAESVTSNPVVVYVHPQISSISLVTTPLSGSAVNGCYSQNQQAELDVQAFYSLNGVQTLFCTPGSSTLPSCTNAIGTLSFNVGTSSVATISPATSTNPLSTITAQLPGTTVINATIAQSSSSAGYFSTCPPRSITTTLANGSTKGVVTQGVTQNLTTAVVDTQGNPITGLPINFESTNPIDISTSSGGSISATFPGVATLYATCQPSLCNPAPINELGSNGTGLSLSSNPVNIIVPGTTSDFLWYGAPGQSQYFGSIELLTGTPGSTVRLPYVPNSMVMDQLATSIYFGSPRELMIYSPTTNSLTKQDTGVPGVVLAAAPNGSQILINDQVRDLFYLYSTTGGTSLTQGGLGVAAAWTPDSDTLYIVDSSSAGVNHTDTLYVYNVNSGWSTYSLPASPSSWSLNQTLRKLAITVPGVGAYISGNPTVAHTWCPSGTVGNNSTIQFYPQSDSVNAETEVLGATSDGAHVLSGELNGNSISLTDIGVTIPASSCPSTTTGTTQGLAPLTTNPTLNGLVNLTGVTNVAAINQVVTGTAPSTASVTTTAPIAFVTYSPQAGSTTAAQLPYYLPQPTGSGVGSVGYVTFADSTSATPPTAPLAGVFSPDNSIFFVSTAGDNEVHYISIPTNLGTSAPPAEVPQNMITPNLPACTPVSAGGTDAGCLYPTAPSSNTYVPVTVITVKPRAVT
jgi:trimeric autotransporter adhesin